MTDSPSRDDRVPVVAFIWVERTCGDDPVSHLAEHLLRPADPELILWTST